MSRQSAIHPGSNDGSYPQPPPQQQGYGAGYPAPHYQPPMGAGGPPPGQGAGYPGYPGYPPQPPAQQHQYPQQYPPGPYGGGGGGAAAAAAAPGVGYPPQPQPGMAMGPGAGQYPPPGGQGFPGPPPPASALPAKTAPPGAPSGPEFLFPPAYNALIRQGGEQGYPPVADNTFGYPPPKYESVVPYTHDFRGLGGARCPQVVFRQGDEAPMQHAEVIRVATHVECNYSAAFVSMSAVFRVGNNNGNLTPETLASATFQLPQKHNSAVTNCKFWVGKPQDEKSWKAFDVSTLATTDAQELAQKFPPKDGAVGPVRDSDPTTFIIPVQGVTMGCDIVVEVSYYERVESFGPNFEILVPLGFSSQHMPLNEVNQRCPVTFAVNAGIRNFESKGFQFPGTTGYKLTSWSSSHQLWANQDNPTRMTGQVVSTVPWPSKTQSPAGAPRGNESDMVRSADFVLLYTTVSETIMGHVIVERAPPDGFDNRDTYALFLTPPTASPPFEVFRRVIFLLDKSYSMQGAPFDSARNALKAGLELLRPNDMFSIHMFSHLFEAYPVPGPSNGDTGFLQATPTNIQATKAWLDSTQCDGGTDILGAVTMANETLNRTKQGAEQAGLVDFCFMLTDGAVSNERDVCKYIQSHMKNVRFLTFGVGGYVNSAFLRMIATTGRGFCDISLNPNCLYDQMVHLMSKANAPLMTDITVHFPGEMYPRVVPDLYHGSSVVVGGKLAGPLPPPGTITVSGRLPVNGGQAYSLTITPEGNPFVPVHRLFVKTMLDDLTAEAWLTENDKIIEQATNLSCNENMACAYTQQVAHPAEPPDSKNKKDNDGKPKKGKKGFNAKYAAAAVGVAAAGAGIYLLATSGAFDGLGNVGATVANAPVIGAMGDALASSAGFIGGAVGDIAGGVASGVTDAAGGCADCCGGICSPVFEGCGGVCYGIGDTFKSCGFGVGDTCKNCGFQLGDSCKDCGFQLGDACTNCGTVCGDGATQCVNQIGPLFENCGDVLEGLCGVVSGLIGGLG